MYLLFFRNLKLLSRIFFLAKYNNYKLIIEMNISQMNLKLFLSTNRIHHRLTCPYTSQQNGIVERKHQHIQEMGWTLLAKAHLSNCYWMNSFITQTSIYKSSKSPFSALNKTLPNYSELRLFSCSCFPFLRPIQISNFPSVVKNASMQANRKVAGA